MPYTPNNNPYVPGDPYAYDLKYFLDKIRTTESTAAAANTAASNAVNTANSAANVAANAQNAATNAVNTANNAVNTANQAAADANQAKYSVIPQISATVDFSNNTIRWYKQPEYDEITTISELKTFVRNYVDLSHSTVPNPAMVSILPIKYARWAHPSTDSATIPTAQICVFESFLDQIDKVALMFIIIASNGDIYRVTLEIDGATFNTFTMTELQIN